jgi:glycine cleavage system H protein
VGRALVAGETFGVVESVKAVSDLYAPVSGQVAEVNSQLPTHLDWLSQSPYDQGWIMRIKLGNPAELEQLMSESAYKTFCEHAGH